MSGMKNGRSWEKRIFSLAICLLGAALLGGCSLAREELETGEDRLAGVFLTREYLETGTAELTVNWKGEVSLEEEPGRIPGEIRWEEGHPSVTFPGVEGYGIYEVRLRNEGSGEEAGYNFTDEIFGYSEIVAGDELSSMETTVYVEPGGQGSFYLNRVYQTAGGEIYLRTGPGLTSELTAGASMSSAISEERTETRDGKKTGEKTEFTIKIVCTEADRPVNILFLDEENNVLRRMSGEQLEQIFSAQEPKLRIPGDTAYLIVERPGTEDGVKREICARGEEYISFLQPWGEGYLRTEYMTLEWE
ncbi:MAG: hypothetical protein NC432_03770 [Roseburia sp.]|nr:hypothetical protein [Roseburia sp.]MCM1098463.1 hypothetical protein [Ruminococcus flavefaciens]